MAKGWNRMSKVTGPEKVVDLRVAAVSTTKATPEQAARGETYKVEVSFLDTQRGVGLDLWGYTKEDADKLAELLREARQFCEVFHFDPN